jgi:uncharacterized protein
MVGKTEVSAISHIIIDGYNVIGVSHRDLTRERERLIQIISGYRKLKGHEIVLVFDGWKSGSRTEEVIRTGGITVIYSRIGEKADAVIKRIIGNEREWIVVSSDREIVSYSWSHSCVPVPSETFLSVVENPGNSPTGEYDPLYEEDDLPKKGNARMLSRKDRAVLRVLKKLA